VNISFQAEKYCVEDINSIVDVVIEEVSGGSTLIAALEKHNIKANRFFKVINSDPLREGKYLRAQHSRSELMVDEIIIIADTEPDPNRARVRTDVRKWVASKLQPSKFGDRIDLNINQTVDVGAALTEARRRALPQRSLDDERDAQVIDLPIPKPIEASGSKSVEPTETRDAIEMNGDSIYD
jgi:hypothetical protein